MKNTKNIHTKIELFNKVSRGLSLYYKNRLLADILNMIELTENETKQEFDYFIKKSLYRDFEKSSEVLITTNNLGDVTLTVRDGIVLCETDKKNYTLNEVLSLHNPVHRYVNMPDVVSNDDIHIVVDGLNAVITAFNKDTGLYKADLLGCIAKRLHGQLLLNNICFDGYDRFVQRVERITTLGKLPF